MKKVLGLFMALVIGLTLSSCTTGSNAEADKVDALSEIDFYIEYNDLIEATYDVGLPDVEEKILYDKEDFFNYDLKDPSNVDIDYDDYYTSFVNLIFVKQALADIDDFAFKTTFTDTVNNESLYIDLKSSGDLYIEYYEYILDIEIIMRHSYELTKSDDEIQMTKYVEIYDNVQKEKILLKKIEVTDEVVIRQEYYVGSGSFLYEYTSYQDQEFFMYKGTMGSDMEFLRQTIEYYIPSLEAYVSYDIKEDELEDYRVKLFEEGHRVLKVDVNVKNSNPTVNELTWNLLSVDGWQTAEYILDDFYIYRSSFTTLLDYEIDVQLNGYGKVTAYKMFEGELTDNDITLVDYDLSSGYTLQDIVAAKVYFESNYIQELTSYGFTNNDPDNRHIIFDNVDNVTLPFEQYIEKYS